MGIYIYIHIYCVNTIASRIHKYNIHLTYFCNEISGIQGLEKVVAHVAFPCSFGSYQIDFDLGHFARKSNRSITAIWLHILFNRKPFVYITTRKINACKMCYLTFNMYELSAFMMQAERRAFKFVYHTVVAWYAVKLIFYKLEHNNIRTSNNLLSLDM